MLADRFREESASLAREEKLKKSLYHGASALTLLATMYVAPSAAFAQSANAPGAAVPAVGVAEVVVTAQRRQENIQNVPISINAVSGDALIKTGITTTGELQQVVPGLTISAVGSGFVSYTYIRGGGTNQLDAGSDPSVAYFVDDIYIGGTSGLQFGLFDIDHVEVLKGPQGTLFGRNAASGAISIVTARPSSTFNGYADVNVGNYAAVIARGSVTGPITKDGSLLGRLSGFYERHEGYTKNLLPGGTDPGYVSAGGARGQLEWSHENLTVLLAADFLTSRDGMTNQFLTGASVGGLVKPTLPEPTDQSFFRHYYDLNGYENQNAYDASARIELKTGIGTFTSISAFRSNKFDRLQDQDATEYNAYILGSSETDHTFSQELRLAGDALDRFHYLAGLYYYNARTVANYTVNLGPAFATTLPPGSGLSDDFTLNTQSYAAFGQATYDLTRRVSLTVGGRYTEDDKQDQRTVNRAIPPPNKVYTVDPQVKFHAFTPAVTLNFKPNDNILAYFSYREGFKSGGFQALGAASATLANIPFLPEHVASYEVGLKTGFFDRRLVADVALFQSDITDQQVSHVDTTFAPPYPVLIENAGQTRDDGIDINLEARPFPALTLTANATLQDARFLQYQSGAISYAGRHQLRSPNFTGYVSAEYAVPTEVGKFTLRGDYSYQSTEFFDPTNTSLPGLFSPAYGVGNARLTFTPNRAPLLLAAYVRNISDTHYFVNVAISGPTGVADPGAPRTYGVELNYRF